ncbi:unnamed protein product [Effrenium voratum]|nr:unnamed protein product [Effrenium voratum]
MFQVKALRRQLAPLERKMAQVQTQLLPLRHLYGGPLETGESEEAVLALCKEDVSLRACGRSNLQCELPEVPERRARREREVQTSAQELPMHVPEVPAKKVELRLPPLDASRNRSQASRQRASSRGGTWAQPATRRAETLVRPARTSIATRRLEPSQPLPQRLALSVVQSGYFEVAVTFSLLLSSATLGIETHINMQDVHAVARQIRLDR